MHKNLPPEYLGMSGNEAAQIDLEVTDMCNNGCGGNWCWIIILLILFCGCGGNGLVGNNNGCGNSCGCC